ncbi:MAG: hypothetical protein F4107_08535 [Gemmatimonadetes bacterium]|nr:hypothetical protein [Gemmatimonadota bacterium]MYD13979.1 hypothetical protein [Gemmatimonadota bacterium]MYI65963.1 hypothetical protein [Gemmatimonadota bacterium]
MTHAWLAEIVVPALAAISRPAAVHRWSTWPSALQFGGETYAARPFEISDVARGTDGVAPVTLSMPASDEDIRTLWLGDPGYLDCTVILVHQVGGAWRESIRLRGRLGQPQLQGDVAVAPIDPRPPARSTGEVWSHEAQTERHPGDIGFAQLAEDNQTMEPWP